MNNAIQTSDAIEVEQQRHEILSELSAEQDSNWAERFAPGSHGCHELLDRALFVAGIVEDSVMTHPACVQNPAWFALAEKAVAALNELYQQVGAEHLANTDEANS